MSEKKNRKKNNLLKICIGLLVLVLILEICIIVKGEKNNSDEKKEIIINSVETPLVDFVYGYEMVDVLKVNYTSEKPYNVVFLADLENEKNIELLKFYFDNNENGMVIGTINGKNGQKMKVSVEQVPIAIDLELEAIERAGIISMQETLLDTIISNFDIVEWE